MGENENTRYVLLLLVAVVILANLRGGDPPSPEPEPGPPGKLTVLIVEETANRVSLPASQLNVLQSVLLREYVQQAGGELRVLDKDVDTKYTPEKWRNLLNQPRDSLPWLYVTGRKKYSGALPLTLEETRRVVEGCK